MRDIADGEQQSYRGKSWLPLGLRRRSQRGPRDFCHGLLVSALDIEPDQGERVERIAARILGVI